MTPSVSAETNVEALCMEQALKASCYVNHKRELVLAGGYLLSEKFAFVLLFF